MKSEHQSVSTSKPLLMILTSHRLDCLKIAMELLFKSDNLQEFERVVFLLNGVSGAHLEYVKRIMRDHREVVWDSIAGPRGRSECISSLENKCVEKYPDRVYMKIDEDVFVPSGWARRMMDAYRAHAADENLALISPLIPNNAFGLHALVTKIYPERLVEFRRLFGEDPTPATDGLTWRRPDVAEWATRLFLDVEATNTSHRRHMAEKGLAPYERFTDRFSIGCICFDYRHWKKMGGVPAKDEPEWCGWIESHGQFNVLDRTQIVLHYSFFVQQDWLDRSTLLEDLRLVNLPDTLRGKTLSGYHFPRWARLAEQAPRVIKRRLGLET